MDLVYQESGIVLGDKRELVDARIASLIRNKKYSGPEEVLIRLRDDESGQARIELLDQISTNLTYFFRENAHFDFIANQFFPELIAKKRSQRSNRIRFWSAACSSGEEAYSLAMVAREFFRSDNSWDFKILATDISTKMLKKAQIGAYTRDDVSKATANMVQRYFIKSGIGNNSVFNVITAIRDLVTFRRLNLLVDQYPFSGLFDMIICRNVMIYFDTPTKEALLGRFYNNLHKHGYLLTGHAESISGYEHYFKRVKVAIYKK